MLYCGHVLFGHLQVISLNLVSVVENLFISIFYQTTARLTAGARLRFRLLNIRGIDNGKRRNCMRRQPLILATIRLGLNYVFQLYVPT